MKPHTRILRRQALSLSLAATAWALTWPLGASAQTAAWPSKPVTLVVSFPAGAGPDLTARLIGEKLAARIGQPVVVENRPGAGALLAAGHVAKSAADGHTLLLTANTVVISPHVLAPGAGGGVDVQKDLLPVIAPATTPLALVAHPDLGARDLKSALELARRTPGALNYGSAGNGTPMHFAGEMMKKSARVDLQHVPYRGVAPSITAALAGEVKLLYVGLGGALPHIKAGKLVPLAVTERARSSLLPAVATATEQGVAGVEVNAWYGIFAPAATPAGTVQRLNQEINEVLKMADVREKLLAAGIEPLGGAAQQLGDFVRADHQRYGALAKELNIKAD